MKSKITFSGHFISQNLRPFRLFIRWFTIVLIKSTFAVSFFLFINSCNNNQEIKKNNQEKISTKSNVKTEINEDQKKTTDKGIGPVRHIKLQPIDTGMAKKGKIIFESKCISCHRETNYVGPSLKGITMRRTPEWIMNMVLNPVGMTERDPIAKEQLQEYRTQMTYQDVSEYEARNILEYFREEDQK